MGNLSNSSWSDDDPSRPKLALMLVEDDDPVREGLGLLLESAGHSVVSCASGEDALRQLRQGTAPDLIVLDLVMPQMSGWEFRLEQKREAAWASIPIVALSGDQSAKAAAIDAAAYLSKPVRDVVLLETIDRIGRALHQHRALARRSELERLVSLGSLIGGIAHEINSPLAFITVGVELIEQQLLLLSGPTNAAAPFAVGNALRVLDACKVAAERIGAVVRCVSLFASADPFAVEPLDVREVLESSLQVAADELRHCARLERDYASVPGVFGNPAKLGQVFLNLLLNAVFAIRESEESDHSIRVATSTIPGWVVVDVSDSASISTAGSSKAAFDPLASVRASTIGLHFGLAVSREVVESMGGSIAIRHDSPRGSTITLLLPACARTAAAPVATAARTYEATGRSSIVVIDDDPLMCELLAALLDEHYEVQAFSSSRDALAALLGASPDLIICDLMMPEMDGIDLFSQLSVQRPEMVDRFVLISGGGFTERARQFLKQTDRPVLKKPFARPALIHLIEQTLSAAASKLAHDIS